MVVVTSGWGAITVREQKRTTGHVNSSAHTWDVHTRCKDESALRDKALWVMGLISKVNTYSILTEHNTCIPWYWWAYQYCIPEDTSNRFFLPLSSK